MDFRVKKLILEEGMKNIAETEGVKLNMNFDDYHKAVEVEFEIGPDKNYSFEYVRHTCSYGSLENPCVNVFATIEKTRQEVHNKKYEEEKNTILERIAEKWPTSHEYLVPQGTIDAQKDLQEILEGKVDPLMIKVDGEFETPKRNCETCKHEHADFMNEPCKGCLSPHNHWEPKE